MGESGKERAGERSKERIECEGEGYDGLLARVVVGGERRADGGEGSRGKRGG